MKGWVFLDEFRMKGWGHESSSDTEWIKLILFIPHQAACENTDEDTEEEQSG